MMTQREKILRYMLKHKGMTMRDGYMMYINSPHKRIADLERLGIKIEHATIKTVEGKHIVFYRLIDPAQEEIAKVLGGGTNGKANEE